MFLDGVDDRSGVLELDSRERECLQGVLHPLKMRLQADMAMISYLTESHHHIAVESGIELPPEAMGRVGLEHSICVHSVAMDFPLVVDDAIAHPLLKTNLTIKEFGVAAYLGAPVHFPDGRAVGTVCVMQRRVRRWSSQDIKDVIDTANTIDDLFVEWDEQR